MVRGSRSCGTQHGEAEASGFRVLYRLSNYKGRPGLVVNTYVLLMKKNLPFFLVVFNVLGSDSLIKMKNYV